MSSLGCHPGLCTPFVGLCTPCVGLCTPFVGLCTPYVGLCTPCVGLTLVTLAATSRGCHTDHVCPPPPGDALGAHPNLGLRGGGGGITDLGVQGGGRPQFGAERWGRTLISGCRMGVHPCLGGYSMGILPLFGGTAWGYKPIWGYAPIWGYRMGVHPLFVGTTPFWGCR